MEDKCTSRLKNVILQLTSAFMHFGRKQDRMSILHRAWHVLCDTNTFQKILQDAVFVPEEEEVPE